MAKNREPFKRMLIIGSMIQEGRFNKREMIQKIKDDLGKEVCDSTVEKDMEYLKNQFDAPIKYDRINRFYYYSDPDYEIWREIIGIMDLYMNFPPFIKDKLYEEKNESGVYPSGESSGGVHGCVEGVWIDLVLPLSIGRIFIPDRSGEKS